MCHICNPAECMKRSPLLRPTQTQISDFGAEVFQNIKICMCGWHILGANNKNVFNSALVILNKLFEFRPCEDRC